jgi:hypothetical protein
MPHHAKALRVERVGLCAACRHVRVIESGRGSQFYLCTAAQHNPQLKKYPPLPVLRCSEHVPTK